MSEQARYLKVSTTFEVSAESLQRAASTDPSAEAALSLLGILAFMHRQDVSEDIFVRAWKYEEFILSKFEADDGPEVGWMVDLTPWHTRRSRSVFPFLPLDGRKHLLRKARAPLERLSLVSVNRASKEKSMSVHSMVHTWARQRFTQSSEVWLAVASLLALSAEGSLEWQPFTSRLVRHHEANFSVWQDMGSVTSDRWGVFKIGFIFAWQMYHANSVRTVEICPQLLQYAQGLTYQQSEQAPVTSAQHLLGIALLSDGQISKAKEVLERVVQVQEKLDEDHTSLLASQHMLARVYLADNQFSRSIEMLEHVTRVQRLKLEEEDPLRLASQQGLAGAYRADEQISKTIEILEHVVTVRQKLKEDHPDRLLSENELASAYLDDGQTLRAVAMLERVVKVQNKALREDHPDRLVSKHALAHAYMGDGQISKAIAVLEHVVKVRESLDEDHPERLACQYRLARAYLVDGQVPKAIEMLEHVIKMAPKLREDHSSRLASEEMLARVYDADGRTSAAIELLSRVVATKQRTLREDHLSRIESKKLLAEILEHAEAQSPKHDVVDMASAWHISRSEPAPTRRSRLPARSQKKA